ncbi:DNA mismatch repair protein mutH [Legionella busanensis]|uniref:DNA mismatch repair protein MutH n=1 Tax=Legionella busanensis TaxID=190655 RepID=A0A378JKX2_9GAMM|nr:DNA mismatch repair endonuclease MutH [Legionella busanensis]STX51381.1 DNA mismatch repair protein mutH [Legionella busanensis]
MNGRLLKVPPINEKELLARCLQIEGISFAQLANLIQTTIPKDQSKRKGWAGLAIEIILGATAGTKALPDFIHLGVELKTIPFNGLGKPAESTFITTIPLLTVHQQNWLSSECYKKLKRILWIPVEGAREIPFEERRIGHAYLWSPTAEEEAILKNDWLELTTMIGTGRLENIDASLGQYLQVRPKAANARSLCYGFNSEGSRILTLPRGFYLRRQFTEAVFAMK